MRRSNREISHNSMAENNKVLISETRTDLTVEDEILSVTVLGKSLRLVCAVEELSIEKLQFTAFTQLFLLSVILPAQR